MKKTLQFFFLCCLHAALLCSWAAVASVETKAVAPMQRLGGSGPGKDVQTFLLTGKVYTGQGTGLGEVIPESVEVPAGESQSFDIIPDYGQYIYLIRVDGLDIDMDDDGNLVFSGHAATYTFSNVQQAHFLEVVFEILTYNIHASATAGGSIEPAGTVVFEHGDHQTYTMMADDQDGYELKDVLLDGVSQGAVEELHLHYIQSDHEIEAIFGLRQYPIVATAIGNGSITPAGTVTITHGLDQAFFMEADEGHHISQLMVDGDPLHPDLFTNDYVGVYTHTFTQVQEPHSISVTFSINTYEITALPNEDDFGSVLGGGTYDHGDTVELTANPEFCHYFDHWLEDGQVVEGARSLEAHFSVMSLHDIFIPNALMPASHLPDNSVFKVRFNLDPLMFRMKVFNRRGGSIFERDDFNHHWDGYVSDQEASQGPYVYQVIYTDQGGKNHQRSGVVMLIR